MSLRSPLGRVLGLGSAKSGFRHWWAQRLTAVALAPLGLWFAVSMLALASTDYWSVAAWVAEPFNAVLLILLLLALLYHSSLGLQVVMEDYLPHGAGRLVAVVAMQFLHIALAVSGLYAIVTLSIGSQG
jgi:succinate dehydrogenase / fumarate reductase, membrane anchor subunit